MAGAPVKTISWKSGRRLAVLREEDDETKTKENKGIRANTLTRSLSLRINSIRHGATKTFDTVRGTFDELSQKLKRGSTRRRYRLENASTPTPRRQRRTPVKMYSPFSIETPKNKSVKHHKQGVYTPRKCDFHSPSGKLREDVSKLSNDTQHFATVARQIVLRSSSLKKN